MLFWLSDISFCCEMVKLQESD